jgi:transcriptional regulator with XRE-family HTH domain
MKKTFMGVRLKRLREEQRLTQAALAGKLGISLSYLNQLENNQRPLTVPVLLALNSVFGLDVQAFAEGDEARLISDLREALADPSLSETIAVAELRELAQNMPAVGRALVNLNRKYRHAAEQYAAISARLGDDRQAAAAVLPDA